MKFKYLLLLFIICFQNFAQDKPGIFGDTNWIENWTNFKPQSKEYKESTQILSGTITVNTLLSKKNVYLLMGTVRIAKKAILTIEPGTVIRGDFESCGALMITKGSQIIAKGTATDPIVFTSNKNTADRKAGDWGGLIILGDATLNTQSSVAFSQFDMNTQYNAYGGKNELDSSGILKYVRIEFAGKKDQTGYSSNGISLLGVGSKTVLEYINVLNCFDDSFQIYGGNVNLSNIVSFQAKDDDFDITQGAQFTINNSLIVRNPYISDILQSRSFEIDTSVKADYYDPAKKKTNAKLSNLTMVCIEREANGLVKEAIFLHEDTQLSISKCIISGFSSFISFDNDFLIKDDFKKLVIQEVNMNKVPSIFVKKVQNLDPETTEKINDIKNWFLTDKNKITQTFIGVNALFKNDDFKNNPDFRTK